MCGRRAAGGGAGLPVRVRRSSGARFGFFATSHPAQARFAKCVVADDSTLRHQPYSTPRMRQAVMQNRDIIKLFDGLRVSDSFLLHTQVREILFCRPDYLSKP